MTAFLLAASNIGWTADDDARVMGLMAELGYSGLEVAPTRVFPERPYENLGGAAGFAARVKREYGLRVCSMQSIWFGRDESLFDPEGARWLLGYSKRAVDFAHAMECPNIVFGCPRNRRVPEGRRPEEVLGFFRELGGYARGRGVTVSFEANPAMYGTNFMNTTREALKYISAVASGGVALNLDLGAAVANGEPLEDLLAAIPAASHVHVSEPGLAPVVERGLHADVRAALAEAGYGGYVSLEMNVAEPNELEHSLSYMRRVFG